MSDSDTEPTVTNKPAASLSVSSHSSDQENENSECDQKSTQLRLVAIEKLMAPKLEEDTPAVNGRDAPRRAAAGAAKNVSVIEITSSSAASSDDEVLFVPKSRKPTKPTSSDDTAVAADPSNTRSSPVRDSLKMRLIIPKNVTISRSSSVDYDSETPKKERKSKRKSPRKESVSSEEDEPFKVTNNTPATASKESSDEEIVEEKRRKLKIAVTKLPMDLKPFKEQLQLDEIVSFAGKPIENMKEVGTLTNGRRKLAGDSDSVILNSKILTCLCFGSEDTTLIFLFYFSILGL
jgi:hypothetical protein